MSLILADWDGPGELRNLSQLILSVWLQNPKMAVSSRLFGTERTDNSQSLGKERSLLQRTQLVLNSATTELIVNVSKLVFD